VEARWRTRVAMIADVKMASTRDGQLIASDRVEQYGRCLQDEGGVDALATVTESARFGGSIEIARRIRRASSLPLMRKDFFRTLAQVDQTATAGFDALQLTLRTIGDLDLARTLRCRAEELGLEVVIGVHTAAEVSQAVALGARMVGINNRDIRELELDGGTVSRTVSLTRAVPPGVLVISESGLRCPEDVARAWAAGADAVLVGTALAR